MVRTISPDDVMPEGNASMPIDAPTVAVVVSLNIPQMTDEIAGLVARFTKVALTELNDVGARVVIVDSSKSPLDPAELAKYKAALDVVIKAKDPLFVKA